jgi:hypothetical protein
MNKALFIAEKKVEHRLVVKLGLVNEAIAMIHDQIFATHPGRNRTGRWKFCA